MRQSPGGAPALLRDPCHASPRELGAYRGCDIGAGLWKREYGQPANATVPDVVRAPRYGFFRERLQAGIQRLRIERSLDWRWKAHRKVMVRLICDLRRAVAYRTCEALTEDS
jgi:hypothetical protein